MWVNSMDQEEKKAKRENQKKLKAKEEKKALKKKTYNNPLQTVWGKILIIILMSVMVLGTIISLVWFLIDYVNKV